MTPVHTMDCITREKFRTKGQAVFEQTAKKSVSFPQVGEQQLNGSNTLLDAYMTTEIAKYQEMDNPFCQHTQQ